MLVSFHDIAEEARLWVYQADRKFTPSEVSHIDQVLATFVSNWGAHGVPLQGAFKVFYDQFIVLAVDEGYHQASGCSIDGSVHIFQGLANDLKIDLFNRMKIALFINEQVQLESMQTVKQKIKEGKVNGETLVFNNLVDRKKLLDNEWIVPLKDTWLKRHLDAAVHNL